MKFPRLSIDLPGSRDGKSCQRCGSANNLLLWEECDDDDRREGIFVTLCSPCSGGIVSAHERLYVGPIKRTGSGLVRRAAPPPHRSVLKLLINPAGVESTAHTLAQQFYENSFLPGPMGDVLNHVKEKRLPAGSADERRYAMLVRQLGSPKCLRDLVFLVILAEQYHLQASLKAAQRVHRKLTDYYHAQYPDGLREEL